MSAVIRPYRWQPGQVLRIFNAPEGAQASCQRRERKVVSFGFCSAGLQPGTAPECPGKPGRYGKMTHYRTKGGLTTARSCASLDI